MKGCVYQMPYVQGSILFLMGVLRIGGQLDYGSMSPSDAYLYLTIINVASFIAGLWGLYTLTELTKKYQLLLDFAYRKKSVVLKLMVIFVNIQGILIDVLARYGVIGCIPPFVSATAMGDVIQGLCLLCESLLLGTFAYKLYTTDKANH